MSKYTTEVRYICEEAAGLRNSAGYDDMNDIVNTAYPKIFDNNLVFYNEATKTRLLPKILLHYYMREIGFETVAQWKYRLNQKLREILPYYNQLYASEDLTYNPLQNVDNTHTHLGEFEETNKTDNERLTGNLETRNLVTVDDGESSYDHNEDTILRHDKTTTHGNDITTRGNDTTAQTNDVNTHTVDNDRDHWVLFSDTPQGGINGVQNGGGTSVNGTLSDNAYLTNATHETEKPAQTHDTYAHGTITNTHGNVTNEFGDIVETYNKTGDKTDHVDTDGWDKYDNTNTHTGTVNNQGSIIDDNIRVSDGSDSYTKRETGKIGVETYQEMVLKYRKTFLNIDMQIIDELGDLFMKVW